MKHSLTLDFISKATRTLALALLLLLPLMAQAQHKMRVYGYVVDTDNRGIELANVYAKGTIEGTTTNRNGYYDLQLDVSDSVVIVYSMVGYQTMEHTLMPTQRIVQISVEMPSNATELSDVEVRAQRKQTGTMESLDAKNMRLMPDAAGGSIESMLITFAGVSQTNELSSQYSVRGGNFDENCVYVNGTEVYRPQLIRAGQQEGLSFVNPDMVESLQFSAGGFDAKYGDKMSSVLDITYKKPTNFEASATVSLLGANAYVGTGGDRFTQMHGIRYKTTQYLLGTLDTKGTYKPNFVDYQTYLTGQLDKKKKWEITFLGNFSQNSYKYVPEESNTAFGTYAMARNLTTYFSGQEKDMFRTAFGALGLNFRPQSNLTFGLTASGYYANEQETYDITGEYMLSEVQQEGSSEDAAVLGVGTYHEHARNRLNIGVFSLAHDGAWKKNDNNLQWGISLQNERISDKIREWEWRDSVGYSLPTTNPNVLELYYNMHSNSSANSVRGQGYVQDTYRWRTDAGSFSVTGGVRANWWSFNNELVASPRVSFSYLPGWKRDFGFRFATGLYYQSPFYKEIRDTLTDAYGVTRVVLNHDIKAQRSVHMVLGGDYYFRAFGRPFKFTTEAYCKYADRVISYNVDNVRIRYSGVNDAKAYTAGIDFKLYGELVPGADSWISLSLMQAKENLNYDARGWISRPNEQRYSFSMFFQDYLPNNPKYKMHLKFIWADGLPYSPPRNLQMKSLFRSKAYRRVDIGASRIFAAKTDKFMTRPWAKHIDNMGVQAEFFNLLNFKNVDSYYWVTDIYGQQYASPNYLTGFMFNLKLSIAFK